MPTSVRFYRDVLGFAIISNAPVRAPGEFGWCLLRHADGTEIMLNTAYDYGERPERPDPARVASHGDKQPNVAWYGMKQLYLKDPHGFGLCFQWKA